MCVPVFQMVGKMGGEAMSHLNSSSGNVEPSLYYPGQKRPGEDGGEDENLLLSFSMKLSVLTSYMTSSTPDLWISTFVVHLEQMRFQEP